MTKTRWISDRRKDGDLAPKLLHHPTERRELIMVGLAYSPKTAPTLKVGAEKSRGRATQAEFRGARRQETYAKMA